MNTAKAASLITGYLCLPTPAGEKSKPYILHYLDHFPTKAGVGNRLDHKIADPKGSFVRLFSRSFRHLIVLGANRDFNAAYDF